MKKVFFLIMFCTIIIQAQTYTSIFTYNGTSGITKDSIAFGFNSASIFIFNDATVSDTMFVSTMPDFPANKTFKRVGGTLSLSTMFYKEIATDVIYIKFGVYPTAGKNYRVEVLKTPEPYR